MYSKTQLIRESNRLILDFDARQMVGWGIRRLAHDVPLDMTKVRVVIEFVEFNHMPRYILTAFPIP